MASAAGKIVVLSGLHDGAVADIPLESVKVGSGSDCDIVLRDAAIAPTHLAIAAHGDALRATWYANTEGSAPPSTRVEDLAFYQPIAIGRVWIAVVPSTFKWGQASHFKKTVPDPSPAPASNKAASEGSGSHETKNRRGVRHFMLPTVLAVGLIGTAWAASTFLRSPAGPPRLRPITAPGPDESLTHRIEQLNQSLLARKWLDVKAISIDGHIVLTGHIASYEERVQLVDEAARVLGHVPPINVITGSELVRRVNEFLDTPGIEAEYQGAGRVRLVTRDGEVKSSPALVAKLAQLRSDLGAHTVIVNEAIVDSAPQLPPPIERPFPVQITEIRTDPAPHFRTADGTSYYVGAKLPDGAEVSEISPDRILFTKDGKPITYRPVE